MVIRYRLLGKARAEITDPGQNEHTFWHASGAFAPQISRRNPLNSGFFLGGAMLNFTFAMASPAKKAEISFETAMERLEKIVEEMESGKMLLEDLLIRYEEGMKLVKVCQDRLAQAEQKIQIITRDHAGKTSVKDFATTEPPMTSAVTDSMKENDDVRLF
jgi:exodeoxyribonuclease VII small subunit